MTCDQFFGRNAKPLSMGEPNKLDSLTIKEGFSNSALARCKSRNSSAVNAGPMLTLSRRRHFVLDESVRLVFSGHENKRDGRDEKNPGKEKIVAGAGLKSTWGPRLQPRSCV